MPHCPFSASRYVEQARRHEQRIAGKKEPDQQPSFREDDSRQADVAAPCDDGANIAEAMQQVEQRIHVGGYRSVWERVQ